MKQTIAALIKVQHELGTVSKNKVNAHLRSKYADLGAYLDELDPLLEKYGLAIVQTPLCSVEGQAYAGVRSTLYGPDGEMDLGLLMMPLSKTDAHSVGSAITYARRYAIAGIFKMRADDDDGHAAVHGKASPTKKAPEQSEQNIADALLTSVDWAGELKSLKARLIGAGTKGELLEAWNDANAAIKNGMPKEWLSELSALKDQRKAAL